MVAQLPFPFPTFPENDFTIYRRLSPTRRHRVSVLQGVFERNDLAGVVHHKGQGVSTEGCVSDAWDRPRVGLAGRAVDAEERQGTLHLHKELPVHARAERAHVHHLEVVVGEERQAAPHVRRQQRNLRHPAVRIEVAALHILEGFEGRRRVVLKDFGHAGHVLVDFRTVDQQARDAVAQDVGGARAAVLGLLVVPVPRSLRAHDCKRILGDRVQARVAAVESHVVVDLPQERCVVNEAREKPAHHSVAKPMEALAVFGPQAEVSLHVNRLERLDDCCASPRSTADRVHVHVFRQPRLDHVDFVPDHESRRRSPDNRVEIRVFPVLVEDDEGVRGALEEIFLEACGQ